MENMKSTLLDMLDKAYEGELAFAAGLSEAQRAQTGEINHWAPKDVLIHVAEWDAHLAENLGRASRGEPPELSPNYLEVNDQLFREHRLWSWDQVLQRLEQAHHMIVAQVESYSEAELTDPDLYDWFRGQALFKRVANTVYFHGLYHVAQNLIEQGESEPAGQLVAQVVEQMLALDDDPQWQGTQIYNLGCYFALASQPLQALAYLRQAFELYPGISAWAKEDTDLASLWEDEQFKALVAATPADQGQA